MHPCETNKLVICVVVQKKKKREECSRIFQASVRNGDHKQRRTNPSKLILPTSAHVKVSTLLLEREID